MRGEAKQNRSRDAIRARGLEKEAKEANGEWRIANRAKAARHSPFAISQSRIFASLYPGYFFLFDSPPAI